MPDLKLSEIIAMQHELQDKYKDHWKPLDPENGIPTMLWIFEELGELITIMKKRGNDAIVNDEKVRAAFNDELSDVLMNFAQLAISYGVSADELSCAFLAKHERNMQRDFVGEYENYLS